MVYKGEQQNGGISGQVALNVEMRNTYKVLGRKSEENRPIKRPRHRWEDNINTLRTGAFKLFKCTFPGSKQFQSTFILCFFKNL